MRNNRSKVSTEKCLSRLSGGRDDDCDNDNVGDDDDDDVGDDDDDVGDGDDDACASKNMGQVIVRGTSASKGGNF